MYVQPAGASPGSCCPLSVCCCILQGRVDDMLPLALFDVLQTGFMCLGVFLLVAAAVPFILPVFVLLLIIFYYFR